MAEEWKHRLSACSVISVADARLKTAVERDRCPVRLPFMDTTHMQTFDVILASWGGDYSPQAGAKLLAVWLGPAIVAALATSWISGRRGDGFGKGAGVGVGAAFVAGIFACAIPPLLPLAPLIGVVAAVVTVLRN
jgi:hypothetical protein